MEESSRKRPKHFVDFRNSRLYFGGKFWTAAGLVVACLVLSYFADAETSWGRALLSGVTILGVVIGVLLQPSAKPEDHSPRARQAIQMLFTGHQLLDDVRTVAGQISEQDDLVRTRVGLANMNQDLSRAQSNLLASMAQWDEIAPGAVEESRRTQMRGRQILTELAAKEGTDDD